MNIEKNRELADKPFRLKPESLREGLPNFVEEFQTGYEYFTRYRADILARKMSHMVGQWENGRFMTKPKNSPGGWEEANWNDFTYNDTDGRTRNYFAKKFIGAIEFLEPVDLPETYNREERKTGAENVTECYITISGSMYEKICKAYEDPRTNPYDFIVVQHLPKNPPPTRYEVRFAQAGTPFPGQGEDGETEAESKNSKPRFPIFPHEVELLREVEGSEADENTLVEYIMSEAQSRGMNSMIESRAQEIAQNIIIDGKVQIP